MISVPTNLLANGLFLEQNHTHPFSEKTCPAGFLEQHQKKKNFI